MKKIKKRMIKKMIALVLAACLATINPLITYAKANAQISVSQLSDVLSNMQTMIFNLEKLGFSSKERSIFHIR